MRTQKIVAIALALSITVLIAGCSSSPAPSTSSPVQPASGAATSSASPAEPKVPEAPKSPATISFEKELGSGNYTSGIDFPEGKYDIVAIKGGGNVMSTNAFSGGINAVMGTEEMNAQIDMYEQEYSNINLPNGTVLTISGVAIKISSDKASGVPLTPRDQPLTETIDLGNGNFVSGEDFPAGVYDVIAVSGGGNVSSDNMISGGLNAIMGPSDQNAALGMDMYESEYKNIDFPEGTTLSISGVKIQLIPSK